MKPQIISFHCVLRDRVGKVISSTFNRDVLTDSSVLHLQGLSEGLQNLKAGEKRRITLSAAQAYGFYDLDLCIEISRTKLSRGSQLKQGDEISIRTKGKNIKVFRVVNAGPKFVTLDANHPLAGHDLTFDVEGVQSREATIEEVAEFRNVHPSEFYH